MGPEDYRAALLAAVGDLDMDEVRGAADRLAAAWARGATVFVVGNGGSAATASHMTCDLAKSATVGLSPGVRAVSLHDAAAVTAWANDVAYEAVFAAQLATQARPGDLLVVISASGNSPNVLQALVTAKAHRVETLALLGFDGGSALALADHAIVVGSAHYGVVEDVHLAINHMVTEILGARLAALASAAQPGGPR
ncbi:SIS domain-containing protein [Saccharopolyspora sp. 5N708]|uniref:SIS domain-containing protein n=1 Tax=Saccharopolyspora sp. 5N708 TaxID=3457424 RepID=UPI003FD57E8D